MIEARALLDQVKHKEPATRQKNALWNGIYWRVLLVWIRMVHDGLTKADKQTKKFGNNFKNIVGALAR